ncbi:hypothetical protein FPV67DRAFT_1451740 [Lyophyllum atratum]|nr:hypothetical protein FPV67DRAFT_1451740 [Lyophyllum atratum]
MTWSRVAFVLSLWSVGIKSQNLDAGLGDDCGVEIIQYVIILNEICGGRSGQPLRIPGDMVLDAMMVYFCDGCKESFRRKREGVRDERRPSIGARPISSAAHVERIEPIAVTKSVRVSSPDLRNTSLFELSSPSLNSPRSRSHPSTQTRIQSPPMASSSPSPLSSSPPDFMLSSSSPSNGSTWSDGSDGTSTDMQTGSAGAEDEFTRRLHDLLVVVMQERQSNELKGQPKGDDGNGDGGMSYDNRDGPHDVHVARMNYDTINDTPAGLNTPDLSPHRLMPLNTHETRNTFDHARIHDTDESEGERENDIPTVPVTGDQGHHANAPVYIRVKRMLEREAGLRAEMGVTSQLGVEGGGVWD